MNGATPAPRPSARGALAALLVPGGAVVLLAALLGTRVRVSWPGVLLAAALYSLAAWTTYRLGLALRRGRWKELLLGFASAAAALGLAEAALRVLRPYESLCRFRWIASARYHHMNPPRRRMFSGYVEGAPIVVETNEDGLRTHHSRQSFRAQAVRVAVLGDSFVFGSGVNAQEAFPARLERRLQAHALPGGAAVLNAGIISFSPFLERRLFDDVVREYRPTVVLLFLDVTDIGDDAIYARKAGGQGTFPLEGEAALACHGAVYQLAQPALEGLGGSLLYPYHLLRARQGLAPPARASYYTDPVVFQGRPENRYFIYRYPLEQTRPYFAETLRNVEAVAASARAAGARFVLVVFPRYHHWSGAECRDNWERGAYREDEPFQYEHFRFFAQAAPAAGLPLLDLLPAFAAAREFPLVFRHDPHWNARGHDFVAGRVEEYLGAEKLLP